MEKGRLMQSMLLDFYGELLTDKQRECFELHYNEDLSLAEIAEELCISRQGVWDNIRRAEASMQAMEDKTGLIRRFSDTQSALSALHGQLGRLAGMCQGEARELARAAEAAVEALLEA